MIQIMFSLVTVLNIGLSLTSETANYLTVGELGSFLFLLSDMTQELFKMSLAARTCVSLPLAPTKLFFFFFLNQNDFASDFFTSLCF